MTTKLLTLVLVRRGGEVLLGMKKRGFGAGKWNGFGGKVEEGESVEDSARREVREECGLEIDALIPAGRLLFRYASDPDKQLDVRVFRVDAFSGEPAETEEMRPQWFAVDAMPFDDMWPDDRHWFPLFLAGREFRGTFDFDVDNHIVSHTLAPAGETRTVAVSGGFDPVHIGHVRMFNEAKALGTRLVVILNNDNWLRAKKGAVFMTQEERKEIIEAFAAVDEVVLTSHEAEPEDMSVAAELRALKPDIFANGGDRKPHNTPEDEVCRDCGIALAFNVGRGGKVQSSSWLIAKAGQK